MSLQALTVAVSTSGLDTFFSDLVAGELTAALAKLEPPDTKILVPAFRVGAGVPDEAWCYKDIVINLNSGTMDGFKAEYKSMTQQTGGVFRLTLGSAPFTVKYKWNENFQMGSKGKYQGQCSDFGGHSHQYDYSVRFAKFIITVDLKLSYESSQWKLAIVQTTTDPGDPVASIPSRSIVNLEQGKRCGGTQISDKTKSAVETIDFRTPILKILDKLALGIPSTGHLTPKITFDFGTGPSAIDFPGDKGVQIGVTGQVTYQGKSYPGGSPPQLPLPAVPEKKDLAYYAAAYEFDSLFWAFFKQGLLAETVTPGDLPDPAALHTNSYKNGPLQGLAQKYPDLTMTAAITATAAPTVSFQTVYDLSDSALASLKSKLPADVYKSLSGLANEFYLDEASFDAGLVNALGQSAANQWKATIENAAQSAATVVEHQDQVILNVLKAGNTIPVLTFSVTQKDVLSDLALGISASGKTQTLQFGFQIVPASVETKLISSTIPSITTNDFGFVWTLVLEPQYANEVAKMGQQGIALPRIPEFAFLFEGAQIAIETSDGGYVSVLTDVEFNPSAAKHGASP